jgi:hypothetical protein
LYFVSIARTYHVLYRFGEQAAMWDLYGIDVGPRWICRRVEAWGYSWKRVRYKLAAKYTQENLRYYGNFVFTRWDIPWLHQKYADEAHFASFGGLRAHLYLNSLWCALQSCGACEASASAVANCTSHGTTGMCVIRSRAARI